MSGAVGSVSVRPLRWWDLAAVHALEASLFPSDAWSLEQFWQELAQSTRRYVVAVDGDDVVGFAGLYVNAPDADIQTVGVRGDQQGRGVARAMLTGLLDFADSSGVTHTMLEVRADNAAAIRLYEWLGFEQISARPRYYADGVDALIMRRPRGAGLASGGAA